MKRKTYLAEQVVVVLKQAELGPPVSDLIQQFAIFGTPTSSLVLRSSTKRLG